MCTSTMGGEVSVDQDVYRQLYLYRTWELHCYSSSWMIRATVDGAFFQGDTNVIIDITSHNVKRGHSRRRQGKCPRRAA
jgi:hypothetical protein